MMTVSEVEKLAGGDGSGRIQRELQEGVQNGYPLLLQPEGFQALYH